MRLLIKATNLSLTPALKQYIETKIGELARFFKNVESHNDAKPSGPRPQGSAPRGKRDPIEVRVEVGKPSLHHKHGRVYYAEVNVDLPGRVLRAESSQWDVRVAIDEVKDEMQRELTQYTERRRNRSRQAARKVKDGSINSP